MEPLTLDEVIASLAKDYFVYYMEKYDMIKILHDNTNIHITHSINLRELGFEEKEKLHEVPITNYMSIWKPK